MRASIKYQNFLLKLRPLTSSYEVHQVVSPSNTAQPCPRCPRWPSMIPIPCRSLYLSVVKICETLLMTRCLIIKLINKKNQGFRQFKSRTTVNSLGLMLANRCPKCSMMKTLSSVRPASNSASRSEAKRANITRGACLTLTLLALPQLRQSVGIQPKVDTMKRPHRVSLTDSFLICILSNGPTSSPSSARNEAGARWREYS